MLSEWVRSVGKTKSAFNKEMGYSSNQGYLLLAGKRQVTFETVGRLLVVYGSEGPAEKISEAMRMRRKKSKK